MIVELLNLSPKEVIQRRTVLKICKFKSQIRPCILAIQHFKRNETIIITERKGE